ncbi:MULTISPECIES: ATP synthase subunit I [unclassified Clostridium]|uniref:ATP synthase subunit I n=1 Tax=unclassified Clostridium TaxID=2614128 RepID=UPI00290D357F|nr:ATP synthase subunit I [Clostridium sp.]MDU5106615.1 ATP synthase subunit I [Clostridium sp.]
MSREMKNTISNMIKYDLIAGFIFVLILSLFFNLKVALIFFLGLMISLINTSVNGLVIEYSLLKDKKILLPLSYVFRIIAIILIALPFLNNLIQLLSYISGYLTHFLLVVIYWLKKEKGSD